jgi:AraC family transcriptional regulator
VCVETRFATHSEEDGVAVVSAEVNGFLVSELRFPPGYRQLPFEPEYPYLAVVLEGSLEKIFPRRMVSLTPAQALVVPVGATHHARFGASGARIALVRQRDPATLPTPCLERLVTLRGAGLGWLAWRLAGELRAADPAAPLAAEGLALELLAAASRETRPPTPRRPFWLREVEELLRARLRRGITLKELGDAVGVHPAHLARVFRAHHGVSVGEYARRQRLASAAAELACTDTPLAVIATNAGFADQSHFTRLFRQHLGITPARYRSQTRSTGNSES